MCGIAGILGGQGERPSAPVLLDMAAELNHRGPDGTGVYLDGPVALANTRLAIVDIGGGDQPLSDDSGRYFVVQNGEIYNHIELREELETLGQKFETHSDTEVIAHAYARWGLDALERMNGAFAFALWDRQEQKLVLARDRLGKRPLFLAKVGTELLFASEVKSILRHPKMERRLSSAGLAEQIVLWGNLATSCFEGVRELAPGHVLISQRDGRTEEKAWWRLSFAPDESLRKESEDALAERTCALLEDSVRLRLRADVPVAAYLSGGLDSSAIVALAKRHASRGLNTFAVRFDDPLFDEREEQDAVARALDVPLDAIEVSPRDIAHSLVDVVRFSERPFHRTAPGPLFLLSGRVRETGTKVVLTGEGADEIFAGYHIFQEAKVRRFWAKYPDSTSRPTLLARAHPYLANDLGRTGKFLFSFFGKGLTEVDDPLYSHQIRFANTSRILRLLHPELLANVSDAEQPLTRLRALLPEEFSSYGPLSQAQWLEMATFFQSYLLHTQGDRMLMGHSVEGRFPFLDHRLVEFAASLPETVRMKGLKEKYILRKGVAGLLPKKIARRPKQPYRAPILRAIAGEGAPDAIKQALSTDALLASSVLNGKVVDLLVKKCRKRLQAGVSESDEMALVFAATTMLLQDSLVDAPALAQRRSVARLVIGDRVMSDEFRNAPAESW